MKQNTGSKKKNQNFLNEFPKIFEVSIKKKKKT